MFDTLRFRGSRDNLDGTEADDFDRWADPDYGSDKEEPNDKETDMGEEEEEGEEEEGEEEEGEEGEGEEEEEDVVCDLCGSGEEVEGNLILLCDGTAWDGHECLAALHRDCVGLDSIPEGDWFCPVCM